MLRRGILTFEVIERGTNFVGWYYNFLLRSRDSNRTIEKTAIDTIKLESVSRGTSMGGVELELVIMGNTPPDDITKSPFNNHFVLILNVINHSKWKIELKMFLRIFSCWWIDKNGSKPNSLMYKCSVQNRSFNSIANKHCER